MIPVSLRLHNFLSYGTAADPLDFEAFSVACLSGKNGQGKSALLDAMTWAIWGEGRKSSGVQKPDDELLRIGARDMEVEFVFDLGATRYRVVRTYHRSASGKTSKPGLEFQVFDPDAGDFRPLTAESVRATQGVIDAKVGIDYETFINSAFLLQGRSDEFTKKKPGERKDILGRILGIDAYERLAARAGQRYSERRDRVKRHDEAIDRLKARLDGEADWIREHAEVERVVERLRTERRTLEERGAALQERRAAFEAVAAQVTALEALLTRLGERAEAVRVERAELGARIEAAEVLVGRAADIVAANERYEDLVRQRNALDEQATLAAGLDHQLQQLQLQLERKRLESDRLLERLEADLATDRQRLADDDQRLQLERPSAQAALDRSLAAAAELDGLTRIHDRRERLTERLTQLDRQLDGERNRLIGTLTGLQGRIREAERAPSDREALLRRLEALDAERVERAQLQEEMEQVRETGTEARTTLSALEAERERLGREIETVEERRALIHEAEAETCPTCGTALTEAHRATVSATYSAEIRRLETERERVVQALAEAEGLRDRLRAQFIALRDRIKAQGDLDAEHARVREKLERLDETARTLARDRTEAERLQVTLDGDAYLPELQAERTRLAEERAEIEFDASHFQRVQQDASMMPERRAAVERLEALAERRDAVRSRIAQREAALAEARARADAGVEVQPLRERIEALRHQREAVGYSAEAHEAARRALGALADAPEQFLHLVNAQRDLGPWKERSEALDRERERLVRDRAHETERKQGLIASMAERDAVEEAYRALETERSDLDASLSDAQARLGGLAERLERCAQDREALAAERTMLREAKREAALYRHLRAAFGKNGIPSLIIEETLPEIEDRANALLDRLSNGRTRVALETLADKKSGGTKETLDIRITDEQGVARSYETFSGGEAFRVNFALRIALAQLLADRSGVPIRTLVIDEGFGTQDREGIQNLVEAIRTIQDDFAKILVITHLDELKDAFPIRIEVTKRPVEGSTFELIGV